MSPAVNVELTAAIQVTGELVSMARRNTRLDVPTDQSPISSGP